MKDLTAMMEKGNEHYSEGRILWSRVLLLLIFIIFGLIAAMVFGWILQQDEPAIFEKASTLMYAFPPII